MFAHHRDVLEEIYKAFKEQAVLVHGDTPIEERDAAVQRFQNDPKCRMFVGSIRACGEGLTLTAANLVAFAEEDWVPSKISQCEDRAHRIGQKDNVLVKHYVMDNSLDAKMCKTNVEKQNIADAALDGMKLLAEPVVVAGYAPTGTKAQIQQESLEITDANRWAIHASLKRLAGMCNGATTLDGMGFNKIDARIGRELAEVSSLSNKQAALGRRIVGKYVKQLGGDVVAACGIKTKEQP